MKVRFLFYRASQERWNLIGHLIAIYTALLPVNWRSWKYWYSHVEIWLPDESGRFVAGSRKGYERFRGSGLYVYPMKYKYVGQCFSSTTRGGAKGVRFIAASELLKHPERWDYIGCEVEDWRVEVALDEAEKLVGKKYDFLALFFGFFTPFRLHDKNKWYCSELAGWFAYLIKALLKRFFRISPRRFAAKLAKRHGQPKRLR